MRYTGHMRTHTLLNSVEMRFLSMLLGGMLLLHYTLGCAVQPSPETVRELRAVDINDPMHQELRSSPIIDVHTHMFNARYLPLRGIALGKRDKLLFTHLISDKLAIGLTNAIVKKTPFLQPIGISDHESETDPIDRILQQSALECGIPYEEFSKEPAVRALRKLIEQCEKGMVEYDPNRDVLTEAEERALEKLGVVGDPGLITNLRMDDRDFTELYRRLFGLQNREVYTIRHMMDLGPVYDQCGDTSLAQFTTTQIDRASAFQSQPDSGQLYFVAYNPFRDHWHDCDQETRNPLQVVIDAVEEKQAFGVKVYPPSGYRPIENDIPDRPFTLFTDEPERQWDARYSETTNERLDELLGQLLDECIRRDIPVFAHSHTGEMEARSGYGVHHANPKFWQTFLDSDSPDPCVERSELRLCFGHAGGNGFWFGTGDHPSWGKLVRDLCMRYPNVYAEVGVHGHISRASRRAVFVERLLEAVRLHEDQADEYPHSLMSKIMYGSDWYMPPGSSARDYLEGFEQAFLHPGLREYYSRFFYGNAVRFLNLARQVDRPELDPVARERVKKILNNLAP